MTVTPTRRDIAKFGAGLGAAAAISGLPTRAAEAFLRFGGAGSTGGGGGTIPAVTINNFSGTAAPAGTPVRFYHVFKDGDVPTGHFIQVTDGGGNTVPTTFARRNYSGLTHPFTGKVQGYLGMDLICRTARSIAGNGSDSFTLTVMSGSWPDTLPAGKTVANIITDLNTNFVYSATWTNLTGTSNEGNWAVDSATGFAGGTTPAAGGYYRCVNTGPSCADFIIYMPLYLQSNHATKHASLRARIYMTAHLNPTTGAVEFVSGQIWLRSGDYNIVSQSYTAQVANFINGVKINGWGGTVGDGRTFTFTSTDVNTTTNTINLPGNLFVQGHPVQFTTTGTLPGGLSTGTTYWVCPTANGASTVYVYANYADCLDGGNGRSAVFTPYTGAVIDLTSGGTGTHTIAAFSTWAYWAQTPLVNNQGTWDWLNSSGPVSYDLHPVQDKHYYFSSNKCGRLDLSIVMSNTSDNFPTTWAPGSNLALNPPAPDNGGSNPSYGAPWSQFACFRFLNMNDLNGYVRTCRTTALGQAAMTVFLYDPVTHRQIALDGSPNPSYPPLLQQSDISLQLGFATNPPTPTGSQGIIGNPLQSGTHLWMTTHPCYLFDGGQPLLDLMIDFNNATFAMKEPQNTWSNRLMEELPSATSIWTTWPNGESRSDAWKGIYNNVVWQIAPTEGPEATYPDHAYTTQLINTGVSELAYLRSASSMGSNWSQIGYFDWSNFGGGAPGWNGATGEVGLGDEPFIENLFAFFEQSSWMYSYMICPLWQTFAEHIATSIQVQYGGAWPNQQFNTNQWYGAPMIVAQDAPGIAGLSYASAQVQTPPAIWAEQWNGQDGVAFGEDGQTILIINQAQAQALFTGDRIKFWNMSGFADSPWINGCNTPSGVSMFTWYYLQGVTSNAAFGNQRIYTATLSNDQAGTSPVTWSNTNATTTLASGITSSATSFTTSSAVSTPIGGWTQTFFTGTVASGVLTIDSGSLVGTLAIGQVLDGTGVPQGTYLASGSGLSWTLSNSFSLSDRQLSTAQHTAVGLGYIVGTTLNITSTIAGSFGSAASQNSCIVTPNASILPATLVVGGSGSTFTVNNSQTVASSGSPTLIIALNGVLQFHAPTGGGAQRFNIGKLGSGWSGIELFQLDMMFNSTTITAAGFNNPLTGDGAAVRGAYNTTAQAWSTGTPVTIYRLSYAIFETQSNATGKSATFAYPDIGSYDPANGVPYPLQARMAASYAAYLGLVPRSIYDKINAIFVASGNTFGPANSVYLGVADPATI